jgi:branched-chain amino acid transport system ATP-binding protein
VTDIVLKAEGMTAGYGPQPVIHDINIEVDRGEVVALLGANGAGKTTTLLALSGELPIMEGVITFLDSTAKAPLYKRARRGMSYVTEERSVFKGLSLLDNLRCGDVTVEAALALFPELEKRLYVRGGLLSGGEQQMLTLARAIGRKPQLLLADELSLGLAPLVVQRLLAAVRTSAKEEGCGVLLVEQHARKALQYVDRVYVMSRGRIQMSLTVAEARERIGEIEAAYLAGHAAGESSNGLDASEPVAVPGKP